MLVINKMDDWLWLVLFWCIKIKFFYLLLRTKAINLLSGLKESALAVLCG